VLAVAGTRVRAGFTGGWANIWGDTQQRAALNMPAQLEGPEHMQPAMSRWHEAARSAVRDWGPPDILVAVG
jgi:hypothetical protein